MKSYVHRGIYRTKSNNYNGAFFTLGSSFFTTHPFVKKPKTVKTSGEKVFVNNRTIFFFETLNYAMEWQNQ